MDLPYNIQPRFTCWVVEHALLDTKFVLVDVGVQGGIHPRWKALGNFLQVYGFDPLTEAIGPLRRSREPNHEYFSTALGDNSAQGGRPLEARYKRVMSITASSRPSWPHFTAPHD
jgi:hypothetical protein